MMLIEAHRALVRHEASCVEGRWGSGMTETTGVRSSSPPKHHNHHASHEQQAHPQVSHSNKVAELILTSCRLSDPSSYISSVLRDSEGRTVVRVRADPRNNPLVLLKALQRLWPLARSSVHENALDGTVEAEIVVPRRKDEYRRATLRAKRSRFAEFLLLLSGVMFFIALGIYTNDCYVHLSNQTAPVVSSEPVQDPREL